MTRTTKSPKLATPNKSAKKKLHKEKKAKQQSEEPNPKTPKLSTPSSKNPSKKLGKIIEKKQSKSPKAKTPATKTPAKKEQKSKVKKYDGPSKSPSNLAASNKENANTNNNSNNVDEIIRRYSMQSANKSKDELSEEYLAEVSAMEESFKEFDSFELKTELVKEQPGQQKKTAEQQKVDEQQNNGTTGNEGKEQQSGPDGQEKLVKSGTAKKRSASRLAVKTMETPKRGHQNDENKPKSDGKKGNGSPAAGRENKTPVSTKRRTSEKLFKEEKAEEEKKPRRSTRLSTN